jgi:hypothetical protein
VWTPSKRVDSSCRKVGYGLRKGPEVGTASCMDLPRGAGSVHPMGRMLWKYLYGVGISICLAGEAKRRNNKASSGSTNKKLDSDWCNHPPNWYRVEQI